MSSYSSFKWITSDNSVLRAHDVHRVLHPVWNHPTNLISIFGRARQGKSFLMNCLAGETDIFRISNEKESCTQGIDVSNKFMSVRQFATVDGGRLDAHGRELDNIRVGFVDAEGQGDKDVSYDANLICPILLASKCVIFNWKGDMQKDAILNTLGIMSRAAQNVGVESGSSHKFGHLHIVFRDWQAEGSTPEDTFNHIFQHETSSEASTRNKIRRDLQEAFASIRVWLLDAPTELVSDLKKKLTIDKTSALFRSQIRELRAALTHELMTPAHFGESLLTGKVLHGAMSLMAQTLNHGEVVLPGAAYRAMLAEELRANRDHFQREVQAKVEDLLKGIRSQGKIAHAVSDDDAGSFMSGEEAAWLFDEEVGAIGTKYENLIAGILETSPGDHSYDGLRKQEKDALTAYQTQMSEYFFAQWTNEVNKWVVPSRQAAEKRLERLVNDVLQKMPALVQDGAKQHATAGVTSEMLLTAVIQEIWMKVSACFGNKQECFQDNAIFMDAVATIKHKFETLSASLWTRFQECYSVVVRKSIELLAQQAGEEMLLQIAALPRRLYAKHILGFPIDIYMMALNEEFHRLKAQMEHEVRHTLLMGGTVTGMTETIVKETTQDVIGHLEEQISASLKDTAIEQYKIFREEAFASIMNKAGEDILPMLHAVAESWEAREPDMDNVDPDVPYYGPTLKDVKAEMAKTKLTCEKAMIGLLAGWFCEGLNDYSALAKDPNHTSPTILVQPSVQQNIVDNVLADYDERETHEASTICARLAVKFVEKLSEYLQTIIDPFQQQAKQIILAMEEEYEIQRSAVLEQREQDAEAERQRVAAAAAARAAAKEKEQEEAEESYANDDDDYDEYEMMSTTSAPTKATTTTTSATKRSSSASVSEQRRRAMEWAAKNLSAAPKKARGSAATAGTKPAAAAASRFGQMNHVSKKSVEQQRQDAKEFARRVFGESVLEEEDEDDDDESHVKDAAVPVTSARGKSAIEQAKEAARRLQEERLKNQASTAATRAKDAAEKKKRAKTK